VGDEHDVVHAQGLQAVAALGEGLRVLVGHERGGDGVLDLIGVATDLGAAVGQEFEVRAQGGPAVGNVEEVAGGRSTPRGTLGWCRPPASGQSVRRTGRPAIGGR
jgi:hypothetical protein